MFGYEILMKGKDSEKEKTKFLSPLTNNEEGKKREERKVGEKLRI